MFFDLSRLKEPFIITLSKPLPVILVIKLPLPFLSRTSKLPLTLTSPNLIHFTLPLKIP